MNPCRGVDKGARSAPLSSAWLPPGWRVEWCHGMAFERFKWLRERFWSRELWERGYAVRTVGDAVTAELIRRYIRRHKEATNQTELF